jgi:hypothetical protein
VKKPLPGEVFSSHSPFLLTPGISDGIEMALTLTSMTPHSIENAATLSRADFGGLKRRDSASVGGTCKPRRTCSRERGQPL